MGGGFYHAPRRHVKTARAVGPLPRLGRKDEKNRRNVQETSCFREVSRCRLCLFLRASCDMSASSRDVPTASSAPAQVDDDLSPQTLRDARTADLRREVRLLGHALGDAIRNQSGETLYALEEDVRALTKALRRAPDEAADAKLRSLVSSLSVAEAEGLIRAFSMYFHLVNVAEERHRARVNAQRQAASTAAHPRRESLLALVGELKARGRTFEEATALLASLRLHLTFTAHPTETRRRSVRHQLTAVERALEDLDGKGGEGAARGRVALLWSTREVRATSPSVEDEVKGGLFYLPTVLWEVVPRLVEGLEDAVEAHYGRRPSLPPPLVFRSWIGGDRDGNPHVLPDVTAWAQTFAREQVMSLYLKELEALVYDFSSCEERLPLPQELRERFTRDADAWPEFRDEPFRLFALGVRARLRATAGDPSSAAPGAAYATNTEVVEDLGLLQAALARVGLADAAELVRPLALRVEAFGLDLVSLDLREESRAHREAVAELLAAGGVHADYASLPDEEREALLTKELAVARPLAPVGYEPKSRALKVALGSLRAWRARGAYVISMTHTPSDLLDVMVLAREVGLYRPGSALPFDLVPLFETLADLDAAPLVVHRLLSNPVFRAHVRERGGFEVMIGYSDSNKDAGFLAANWALFMAQESITAAAHAFGVPVWFFHGRGTSTARGGGSAGRAIASLPPGTVGSRLRLTEQGEALADRYSHPGLAHRHLEQLLYHLGMAAARDGDKASPSVEPAWRDAMAVAARRSTEAYRALFPMPGFFDFYEQFTPIREIGALKIASRPVYRSGRVRDIKDLRAIPWVMSWSQVRLPLPVFFGLAEGLESIPAELRRRMFREWPSFASTLDSAATALGKADALIAREYLRLVEPSLAERFFPLLERAFARTKELLEDTFEGPLLFRHPALERQIELRNPYMDPISRLQVELLRRYRATEPGAPGRDGLERALTLSLVGIAAGLRNAG
jgi:phosphoenolpyruvate carboxylase